MPKYDHIFVDESGDPGWAFDPVSAELLSSEYYTAAALHMCDDSFGKVYEHISNFRYLTRMSRELKLHPEREIFQRLIHPIGTLAEGDGGIWASAVYLDKRKYDGRYLKDGGPRPQDPVKFRNWVLRRLLEWHFSWAHLQSQQYDLVLDRVELTKDQTDNLQNYLARNYNLPTPTSISHAASIYVEPLQIVHHIATGFKNVVTLGSAPPDALSFIRSRDITTSQRAERYGKVMG
ncbi:MAG: hypothetical protein QGG34_12510 [SAR202 cluster bacterium]|nr:hypothetical protein [SAR202 cluster bacterium]MDP6301063.1 hypothetical protein [SAR202 cluster bacterium]MDP7535017.1 hypothetical protein [SAR202 cluster bacterium]